MSRRILVADDSSTIQKVIKIAFSRYPVEVVEAASYIEALATLSRVKPDALILDASLPGAQGPEDFGKLTSDGGGIPALLLVGTYETIDEARFRACGLPNFLRKPFDSAELVHQIDQLLGGALGLDGAAQPPRGDTIPLGGTQRPAHATVFHVAAPTRPPAEPSLPPGFGLGASAVPPPPPPPPPHARRAAEPPPYRLEDDLPGGDDDYELRSDRRADEPATDARRRGRRAFDPAAPGQDEDLLDRRPSLDHGRDSGVLADRALADAAAMQAQLGERLEAQLPSLVREAVEAYCDRHFKSLAREIIAAELRRLADEKARHLVDP